MRCAKECNPIPSLVSISDSKVLAKTLRGSLNMLVLWIVERIHKSLKELSAKYFDLEASGAEILV